MSAATARKTNGVLPVPIAVANDTPKTTKSKEPSRGRKLILRRIPPGLTESEFWAILGEEWKSGNGKVDWVRFQEGKISQDPSNPSNPGRCYLHLLRTEDITTLADIVQRSTWEDEKKSFNDPALIGLPYLDVSIYQKIPNTKRRTDSKQGTIDQDPDFMNFLDSLTQDPATTKESETDQAEDAAKVDGKVTTTPLVEYLKEKKANKGKEATNAKGGKHARHESQGTKSKGAQEDVKKKGKESKSEKVDKEKAKEPVKLLTKKSTANETSETTKPATTPNTAHKTAEEGPPKSRRANIAAAAKILQRDLGLSPGSAHRRARQDAAKAEAAAKTDTTTTKEKDSKDSKEPAPAASATQNPPSSSAPPSAPTAPKAQANEGSRRSRGAKATKQNASGDTAKGKGSENANSATKPAPMITPVILKRKDDASNAPASTSSSVANSSAPVAPTGPKASAAKVSSSSKSSQKKGSNQPPVTAGATRAFIKHANPSQGVTEPLLKNAMETFGSVTFVEIDKRKGFAYVDFGNHDGLVKAVAASPVSIAQGTVQVLERKDAKKPAAPAPTQPAGEKASTEATPDRPKRGGRGRGRRGGGANASSNNAPGEATGSTAPPAAADSTASTGAG